MKRTIAALVTLALCATAQAEILAQMPNNAGGKIQLSDEPCAGYPNLSRAFSYDRSGEVSFGCWGIDAGDTVEISWDGNPPLYRMYPAEAFTMTRYGNAQSRQQPAPPQRQQRRSTGM